jgi:hypothetical protein
MGYAQGMEFWNNVSPRDKKLFGSYLAGLVEGDGTIVIPEKERCRPTGKINYPFVKICFRAKDLPLAQKLQEILGGRLINHKTYVVLWLGKKEDLTLLVSLVNGYFRGGKYIQLHRLIYFLNKHWVPPCGTTFVPAPVDSSPLDQNAWLRGMSDRDANFSIILATRKTGSLRVT